MLYAVESDDLTAIASAIRSKNGKQVGITLDEMPTEIGHIGVRTDLFDSYVTRTMSQAIGISASFVRDNAFNMQSQLTRASFPSAVSVGESAFYGCASLSVVDLPRCNTISTDAFNGCGLTRASFPLLVDIGSRAFAQCQSLSTFDAPYVLSVPTGAFMGCVSLGHVSMPMCTHVGTEAFRNDGQTVSMSCHLGQLTRVLNSAFLGVNVTNGLDLSHCELIGSSAFYGWASVTSLALMRCLSIGSYAFASCQNLMDVRLYPNIKSVFGNAFADCTMASVYFMHASKVPAVRSGAFDSIGGNIYVPMSMCDAFRESLPAYSSIIVGMEAMYDVDVSTSIGDSAFLENPDIYEVRTTGASIGEYAFMSCANLSYVSMPNVTYVSHAAFAGGNRLTDVCLPACVYLGPQAFHSCKTLTSISLPRVSVIDEWAFYGCTSLRYVNLTGVSAVPSLSRPFEGLSAFLRSGTILVDGSMYSAFMVGLASLSSLFVSQ